MKYSIILVILRASLQLLSQKCRWRTPRLLLCIYSNIQDDIAPESKSVVGILAGYDFWKKYIKKSDYETGKGKIDKYTD